MDVKVLHHVWRDFPETVSTVFLPHNKTWIVDQNNRMFCNREMAFEFFMIPLSIM